MNTPLKPKFQMVAWGLTIQLIMIVVLTIVIAVKSHSYYGYDTIKTWTNIARVVGALASILCIVGSFMMIPSLKYREIPAVGAICVGISFSIGLISSLVYGTTLPINSMTGFNYALAGMVISIIVTLSQYVLLWVGCGKLGEYVRGMRTASGGYATITIAIGVILLFAVITIVSDSYDMVKVLGIVSILAAIAILVGYILTLCGWWTAVSGAAEIDADGNFDNADYSPAAAPATSRSTYRQPTPTEADTYRASLRLLDDAQLNAIMANPTAYKPAFVAEATSMLIKRRAWDKVNALPETQLMEIVTTGTPTYSSEECDAASMVLFTRKSPLFTAQFAGLSPQDLAQIAGNPNSYYEGYVAYAREALGAQG